MTLDLALNRSSVIRAHIRLAARNFATSSRRLLCALKEAQSWGKVVYLQARLYRRIDACDSIAKVMQSPVPLCSASRMAARNGDCVPPRHRSRQKPKISVMMRIEARDRCMCHEPYTLSRRHSEWCPYRSPGTPCSSATPRYRANRVDVVALMVIDVLTLSSGMPSNSVRMS